MSLPENSSIATYGFPKVNYSSPIDPSTDVDMDLLNIAMTDTAAMTRTVDRGWIRMSLAASSGALVLNSWDTVWKESTPTLPVLARSSTGVFTVTFPTTVEDALENTYSVNLKGCSSGLTESCGGLFGCSVSVNVITITTKSLAGSLNDLVGQVIYFKFV